jgi:hypothetical protein
MQKRSVAILLALLMVVMPAIVMAAPASAMPAAPAPPSPSGALTTAIMQTIAGVGTFTGTLTVTSFNVVNGVLNAVGTISGSLTDTAGNVVGTLTNAAITIPLSSVTGTCTILTLHTGAINLSVLGLNVLLSPIDLVITATAAPGNLLGNLLCAVAHLLDSNASLGALASLLNQILSAIRI